jgi:hypothetical protein
LADTISIFEREEYFYPPTYIFIMSNDYAHFDARTRVNERRGGGEGGAKNLLLLLGWWRIVYKDQQRAGYECINGNIKN